MEQSGNAGKVFPIAEVIGAIAAIVLLILQLVWAQDYMPALRHGVQITFTVALTVSAALLALKATRKNKKTKEGGTEHNDIKS